ncbi:MAG: DinB family protein [Candidatus Rokuibacteriota bacterium]
MIALETALRTRLHLTLEHPAADWSSIDPGGWVMARAYNQRPPRVTLEAFVRERGASIEWLRSQSNPDWDSAHHHPSLGCMTAGEVLGAWVAHDHVHIRQLK